MIYGLIVLTALVVILLAILADVRGQLKASEYRLVKSNRAIAHEVEWGIEMEEQRDTWRELAKDTLDNWIETIDARYRENQKMEELEETIDRLVRDKDIHVTLLQTRNPQVTIVEQGDLLEVHAEWQAAAHSHVVDLNRITFSQLWNRSDIAANHGAISSHIAQQLINKALRGPR